MNELQKAEKELFELTQKVNELRKKAQPIPVKNYSFQSINGTRDLLSFFGAKETLFVIHNMGQGCRYCTLWGDGLNGFVAHLEESFALAMVSKDDPQVQRQFANSRHWRFKMYSHGGGDYIKEQSVIPGQNNMPGVVCYSRLGDQIFRKNSSVFGPGDQFCSLWDLLSLAGRSAEDWTPQFQYWKRPRQMDDGGKNLN